jgi:hypothetical protein
MSDTAQHRAEMHTLAQERKRAGKPSWAYTLNLAAVFHNEAMTFGERRDRIVARIQASKWYKSKDVGDELRVLVADLDDALDAAQFDDVWDAICDEADADRVWIRTR